MANDCWQSPGQTSGCWHLEQTDAEIDGINRNAPRNKPLSAPFGYLDCCLQTAPAKTTAR